MPRISYRTTYMNPAKLTSTTSMATAGLDLMRMRSAALDHKEHARHARARGDHIAAAYHESRHQYLSSMKGKAATLLSARTGLNIGHQAGEHFGLNITKGFSPLAHVGTRSFGGGAAKAKPATPHGGGLRGRQHRRSDGKFG